ncbi:MAG: GGDEF domain-containing protein [Pseudomonadota bacterium]|nr:GGDEF domain-containing protein [Pseudomonadota bacterium]
MGWLAQHRQTLLHAATGVGFGACFPAGSLLFLLVTGELTFAGAGIGELLRRAHAQHSLLYVIDTAPIFLGLFASLSGWREDRLRRLAESLDQEVARRTRDLRKALEETRQANQLIAYLAQHDAVTELDNRHAMERRLRFWHTHCQRYRRPISLLFIDLDRFKSVNDSFGHDVGDRYLKAVAGRLRGALRASDHLARWGGDEFAVLLPEADHAQALQVGDKLLQALTGAPVAVAERSIPVSASIGVATAPTHTDNVEELVGLADQAMYRAKRAGRAGCQLYQPPRVGAG